ncbi:HNH endonuclease [Clostridium sp. 19966]|uniref:HNH endonuclease n=1 Tax=Clostridium sp. 19966 TaxID=2768166 RepID=UPI0028DD6FD3|nr:HNH endonuclease [Clostridium sp. 19966]MDT8717615.1 HNH endonuclease [Clostridium sp. 19966]
MPKNICNFNGCHQIIKGNEIYCEQHKRSADENQKERHRIYKSKRTDKKYQVFYSSKEWIQLKRFIKQKYKGICLWSYFINGIIIPADVDHHIIPVKDDWDFRLNIYNIIPLCNSVHEKVHKLYEFDKEKTQSTLRKLINRWNNFERGDSHESS